jgi:hypothetical protein
MKEDVDVQPMEHWTDDAIASNDAEMLRCIEECGVSLGMLRCIEECGVSLGQIGTVWVFKSEDGRDADLIEAAGSKVTQAVDWIVRRGFGEVIDGGKSGRQALRLFEPITHLLQGVSTF